MAGQNQHTMSRDASAMAQRNRDSAPAVLKKKLSVRKANALAREQEIRMMSSAPIDIPRRGMRPPDSRRGGQPPSRRSDRYLSDVSLQARHSTVSSMSDYGDVYSFKVNAFAALTPRPVVRYVETPRSAAARSQNASPMSMRRDKDAFPPLSMPADDFSKKRVDRLADDLDAGALRELLERDRRRTRQQQIDDQEKLQRKLERRAQRQRIKELERQGEEQAISEAQKPPQPQETNRPEEGAAKDTEAEDPAQAPPTSWLRDSSKEIRRSAHASLDSVHVIGNIDDSSIREPKLSQRRSFAPSQDMGMSQSTLSFSHSPVRPGLGSRASSQIYGISRGSTSDLSRTVESERRLSDQSGKRISTFSSIFRRGSSKLKRSYRERFHAEPTNIPNPQSHESFFKSPVPSSAPPAFIPTRAFMSSGTINRPESRFTEHFDDEPFSPRSSRLQSPDIPEVDTIPEHEQPIQQTRSPPAVPGAFPGGESEAEEAETRQRSWTRNSQDTESENVPLSQSLASIDSEGSWMSGRFLKRISQRSPDPVRNSAGSLATQLEDSARSQPADAVDDPLGEPTATGEERDTFLDTQEADTRSQRDQGNDSHEAEAETWHAEVGKRPVLVTPSNRPKSKEGLLKDVQSLSPISPEEESSPVESLAAELHQVTSNEIEGDHAH